LQPLSLFYTFGTNQYNFGTSQKISKMVPIRRTEQRQLISYFYRIATMDINAYTHL